MEKLDGVDRPQSLNTAHCLLANILNYGNPSDIQVFFLNGPAAQRVPCPPHSRGF